jgi:uncharacterized membrane protein
VRTFLLYLHIAGGVALVGELLIGSLWLRSALARGGGSAVLRYALATMAWTSKSIALPAILVNLIAGLALLHFGTPGILVGTKWIFVSIALYVVLSGLWHGMLIPMRKKMQGLIEAAPAAGYAAEERETTAEFTALAKAWLSVSGIVLALLFVILLLMVWKPF